MSSEADNDPEQTPDDNQADAADAEPRAADKPDRSGARRVDYVEYAKYGFPIVVFAVAAVAGYIQGPATTLLVLAAAALVVVIATFWASVRTLVGETPLTGADAYALGAPRAEEEQKRAVIRALKDIEFERSVGKISDEDYRVLTAKYRAEAKRLLRLLDAESHPRRKQVEALVAQRLVSAGLAEAGPTMFAGWVEPGSKAAESDAKTGSSKGDPAPRKRRKEQRAATKKDSPATEAAESALESDAETAETTTTEAPAEAPLAARVCADCSTVNDADAMFCKRCGKRQEASPDAAAEAEESSSQGEEEEDHAARAEKELT